MSSVLHLDMMFIRWRQSGIRGNIVLRGTDGALLATFKPLPTQHNVNGNTYYCVNMFASGCLRRPVEAYMDADATDSRAPHVAGKTPFALSIRVDARKHPIIYLLYKECLSNTEKPLSSINITHNFLLFDKGVFCDNQLERVGYGALVMCSNTRLDAALQSSQSSVRLVDWRQGKVYINSYLANIFKSNKTFLSSNPSPQRRTAPLCATPSAAAPDIAPQETWDSRLYNIFQRKVQSTFNLTAQVTHDRDT